MSNKPELPPHASQEGSSQKFERPRPRIISVDVRRGYLVDARSVLNFLQRHFHLNAEGLNAADVELSQGHPFVSKEYPPHVVETKLEEIGEDIRETHLPLEVRSTWHPPKKTL